MSAMADGRRDFALAGYGAESRCGLIKKARQAMGRVSERCNRAFCGLLGYARQLKDGRSGQGTTEYAILVGVLVVIAVLAIALFRPKIQELWDAIVSGINAL